MEPYENIVEDELIATHNKVSFLPEGSVIETYLSEIHPQESLVTAVYGLIFSENSVLFTLGEDEGHHEVGIPGGHVEKGETSKETLKREIIEETGVHIEEVHLKAYTKFFIPEGANSNNISKYPMPVSYMLYYVGILQGELGKQKPTENGLWLSIETARENSWVKENRALFEAFYQESRYLEGKFDKTFLEVHTEQGLPTGEKATYDIIHRRGLWHRSVHVWVLDSHGRFLVQRRGAEMHTCSNMYECTASGHIDYGYESRQMACMELKEETGILADEDELIYIGTCKDSFTQNAGTLVNNEFDDVYILRRDIDEKSLVKENREISDLRFFDAREFLDKGGAGDTSIVYRPEEFAMLHDYLFPEHINKHFRTTQ